MTFFHDTARDDGTLITVEVGYSPGSETTYCPSIGATGGDDPEVEIKCAFERDGPADAPNLQLTDAEYERIEAEVLENPPEPSDDYGDF